MLLERDRVTVKVPEPKEIIKNGCIIFDDQLKDLRTGRPWTKLPRSWICRARSENQSEPEEDLQPVEETDKIQDDQSEPGEGTQDTQKDQSEPEEETQEKTQETK